MVETGVFKVDKFFTADGSAAIEKNHDGFYYNNNECGYFYLDQGMKYYYKTEEQDSYILANSFFFLKYKKTGDSIEIFTPDGAVSGKVNSFGYPYISGNLPVFYVLKTNGMGFGLYSDRGEPVIKEANLTSMITSISTDKYINTLVSTVDGKTLLYSSKGEILSEFVSHGSRLKIAKSSFIDIEGKRIAFCTGIDPEFVEVYDNELKKTTARFKTDTNFRCKNFLEIAGGRVYYEGNSEIKFYDLKSKKRGSYKFTGEIGEITFDKAGNILISSYDNMLCYLAVFSPSGARLLYKEFYEPADNFNFTGQKEFYFKLSGFIVKMSAI
jgi:hypothetical protein